MLKVVDIGGYQISDQTEDIIKTFSLGSCVALAIYARKHKVLGMAHIALPDSSLNENMNINPCYYADTAVPFLANKMVNKFGCKKRELIAYLFGGANSPKEDDIFCVGEKNLEAIKNALVCECVAFKLVDTGDRVSRTVEMYVEDGTYKILSYPLHF